MNETAPMHPTRPTRPPFRLTRYEVAPGIVGAALPVSDWLTLEGKKLPDTAALLEELCRRLNAMGVPVMRLMYVRRTLHPQTAFAAYVWRRGQPGVERLERGHEILADSQFRDSPLRLVFEGQGGLRRRLDIASPQLDFPILGELREQGATDYLLLPLEFTDGSYAALSWTGDRAGGFSADDVALIGEIAPALALILEVQDRRELAATLLDTYLGHDAGRNVLEGRITRGATERIDAALWYTDMRGFTLMADQTDPDRLVGMLNSFFERMAAPVHQHGGEVLKFIGDAMLAVFRVSGGGVADACHRALTAAGEAEQALADLNTQRHGAGEGVLKAGLSLHVGAVSYGNIGAPARLDFTVIGPAVNLAVRLERLCAELDRPVLMSGEFAAQCGRPVVSLGHHPLRGVAIPVEVFAPG